MNQRLETSSQGDLEMSRIMFPQRGSVIVDLSMHMSDLGQAHRNFLVAQWQMCGKHTDGQTLCEVSSN